MTTRTFTTDYLDGLDLPYENEFIVHMEQTRQLRWATEHQLVFKTDEEDDPRLWSVTYYRPASEQQEGMGEPWGYGSYPTEVTATEVKPVTKTIEVTEYVAV